MTTILPNAPARRGIAALPVALAVAVAAVAVAGTVGFRVLTRHERARLPYTARIPAGPDSAALTIRLPGPPRLAQPADARGDMLLAELSPRTSLVVQTLPDATSPEQAIAQFGAVGGPVHAGAIRHTTVAGYPAVQTDVTVGAVRRMYAYRLSVGGVVYGVTIVAEPVGGDIDSGLAALATLRFG